MHVSEAYPRNLPLSIPIGSQESLHLLIIEDPIEHCLSSFAPFSVFSVFNPFLNGRPCPVVAAVVVFSLGIHRFRGRWRRTRRKTFVDWLGRFQISARDANIELAWELREVTCSAAKLGFTVQAGDLEKNPRLAFR
jgi:hypothetical protein